MTVWNYFFWTLVVINVDCMRTLSLVLSVFQGCYYTEYEQFFAVTLLVSLPVILMFLIFQNYFVENIVLSGIKG